MAKLVARLAERTQIVARETAAIRHITPQIVVPDIHDVGVQLKARPHRGMSNIVHELLLVFVFRQLVKAVRNIVRVQNAFPFLGKNASEALALPERRVCSAAAFVASHALALDDFLVHLGHELGEILRVEFEEENFDFFLVDIQLLLPEFRKKSEHVKLSSFVKNGKNLPHYQFIDLALLNQFFLMNHVFLYRLTSFIQTRDEAICLHFHWTGSTSDRGHDLRNCTVTAHGS